MKYYTNVACKGNHILYRGVENGRRIKGKIDYTPTLFLPNQGDYPGPWKTLQGAPVKPITFESINEARDFTQRYKDVESFTVYGNDKFEYAFIADEHPHQEIDWKIDDIVTAYLDIEVGSESGMPDVDLANNPVTAITIKFSNDPLYYVFGCKSYTPHTQNIHWTQCEHEVELLQKFMSLWRDRMPDIVTGWNVKTFDIPYLVNRICALSEISIGMGESLAEDFSPWGKIVRKEEQFYNKDVTTYQILGVATLDYLQLYRKYGKNSNQESYKLDHIAHVELKERKLDYAEYETLHTLYRDNYQKFIEYNIHDVGLVERLNAKGRLIDLAVLLAYDNKTNYEDCFTQVRMWDCICYNFLRRKHIVVPPKKHSKKDQAYEGAYVKDPLIGLHKWIMGLDLTSLYPHLIMQYNLSPETLIEPDQYTDVLHRVLQQGVNVESLLQKKVDLSQLDGFTITPNGHFFDTKHKGFLAEIMWDMFESRVVYKTKQLEAEKERELCTDPTKRTELAALISRYENLQLAKKVGLNSAYGAMGSEFFRFFDIRIAEGVTLAGQLSIRWIGNRLNQYLNELLKTKDRDFVIASDTDSVYLNLEPLVSKVFSDTSETQKVITFMDQVYQTKLKKVIEDSYQQLADYTHAYAQKMNMKREALADKGIWTAKKRYVLNVIDSEGVRYREPKMVIHGLEAIKSSTPSVCREKIKAALKITLNGTEDELIAFVEKFKAEFKTLPISDIAFPRGCNGLTKYQNKDTKDEMIYLSGTPIHVKGALIYNHWIKQLRLQKDYELIQDGEKVKFVHLVTPNKFQDTVISFIRRIPKEFELEKVVDYEEQFHKTFQEPLNIVLDAIGWKSEQVYTLEGFFS